MSVEQDAQIFAPHHANRILRTQLLKKKHIIVRDKVEIWRDASGWLDPTRITKVTPNYYEGIHNVRIKTSGIYSTRKVNATTGNGIARQSITDDIVTIEDSDNVNTPLRIISTDTMDHVTDENKLTSNPYGGL